MFVANGDSIFAYQFEQKYIWKNKFKQKLWNKYSQAEAIKDWYGFHWITSLYRTRSPGKQNVRIGGQAYMYIFKCSVAPGRPQFCVFLLFILILFDIVQKAIKFKNLLQRH